MALIKSKMKILLRSFLRKNGFELIKLKHHRGISLEADIARLLKKAEVTLFDVGANIGDFSNNFLTFLPETKIYAFEPVPGTFRHLKSRFIPLSNVKCFNAACGDKNREAKMTAIPFSGSNKILNEKNQNEKDKLIRVKMVSLDKFCGQEKIAHIDLLKTDAEGYDLNVLKGAKKMLSKKNISAVYSEVNLRKDNNHGEFFAIHKFLAAYSYSFYAMYDYSGTDLPQSESFTNALWVDNQYLT